MLTYIEDFDDNTWKFTVCDVKDVIHSDEGDYTENPIADYRIPAYGAWVDDKIGCPAISCSVFDENLDEIKERIKEEANISINTAWIKDTQVETVLDYCRNNNLDFENYDNYYKEHNFDYQPIYNRIIYS